MPTNKSQHFVPQHYLRQFRIEGTEKQIGVVQLEPLNIIPRGSISGQCQQDYFYRDDGQLDALLTQCEDDLAPVLIRVSRTKEFDEKELVALRFLAVILHVRNRKTIEVAKLFPKKIAYEVIKSAIVRGELPPCPDPGVWKEGMMDFLDVAGSLMKWNAIPCWLEMQTLGCKLLEAAPKTFFISSDHPVEMMNQLFASSEPLRSFVGFSRSGFQLLLPISPTLCIFFYDPFVYKVGAGRRRLVQLSPSDVELVNALQVQSAEECVYFHDPKRLSEVHSCVSKYMGLRASIRNALRELPGRNPNEALIHVRQPSVKLTRPWSFCTYRKSKRIGEVNRRNPAWSKFVKAIGEDMDAHPDRDVFTSMEMILGEPFTERVNRGLILRACVAGNPNVIPSFSPGLARNAKPWVGRQNNPCPRSAALRAAAMSELSKTPPFRRTSPDWRSCCESQTRAPASSFATFASSPSVLA